LQTFQKWGIRTLGDLAALPAADLVSRFGRPARQWQAFARGEDLHPFVPTLDEERFEATFDLEWPIEGLEPLSFVLTRMPEPLCTRLERRDRGAAVLHVILDLVDGCKAEALPHTQNADFSLQTSDCSQGLGPVAYIRRLELPTPMRDVRALRTLALLD